MSLTRQQNKKKNQQTITKAFAESETVETGNIGLLGKNMSDTWDIQKIGNTIELMCQNMEKNKIDITNNISEKIQEMEHKFEQNLETLKNEVSNRFDKVAAEMESMKEKEKEIQESIEFQAGEIEELKTEDKRLLKKMEEEVKNLQDKITLSEKHDRKYNLLFYGIPYSEHEDINAVMTDFFKNSLEINYKMQTANQHRLQSSVNKKTPPAVIVKFLYSADKEAVLTKARKLPRGQHILKDLPTVMKTERHRLAGIAYDIRRNEKLKTRIRDIGIEMVLETRSADSEIWTKRPVSKLSS